MTSVVVIGSVNLDIVATADRLPAPGETVTGATLNRYPGGKGANQALAAARLGAEVSLLAHVGNDTDGEEALALLREGGVDLKGCKAVDQAPTGVALISVARSGENQIVVAPGANRTLSPDSLQIPPADALLCQLEVPTATVAHAAENFDGFFCVNLAPARHVDVAVLQRADLVIVNETEAAWYGDSLGACKGMIATTFGAAGAVLSKNGVDLVRVKPPRVTAVDTTAAGDTFCAALTVALVAGDSPEDALTFACAAGAVTATRMGAQPSLPSRQEVLEILKGL
jgi:ribokinase